MNKSKKYKYFRKNRHNKHKTRKIQRGGFRNPFKKSPSTSTGTDSKPLLTPQNEGEKRSWWQRNKNPVEGEKKPQNEGEKRSWFTRKKKPVDDGNGEIELQPMKNSLQTQQMVNSQEHNTNKENTNTENPNKKNTEPQKGHDTNTNANDVPGTKHDNQPQENKGTNSGAGSGSGAGVGAGAGAGSGAGAGAGAEPTESTEQTPSDSTRNKKKEEKILAARTAALAQAEELEKTANTRTDPQIQNELRAKAARLRSIAQEHPDPDVVLIPKGAKNGLLGWFSSFFKKSQQNLPIEQAQVALTDQMPDIIKDAKENAELIREVIRTYITRIRKILRIIYKRSINENNKIDITTEESDEIDDLLRKIDDNYKILKSVVIDPSQVAHAELTGNLQATTSIFGSQPPPPKPIKPSKPANHPKQPPPPPGQQPPGQQPPGQLPPGAQQAAQQHAEQSKPQAGQQPPKPPGGPPNKPPPPPPPPPPKPPSMPKAPSSVPITSTVLGQALNGLKKLTGGGDGNNKTRKNRQYIHEIKENRTQLFNKEMEIINSIRNFKHGHGHNENGKNKPENIEKKFIKVIKRS